MFCGTSSFKSIDHGDEPPPTSPKGSKKKTSKNNPYSSRGLDKYSTVLGELQARRTKIMEKAGGPQGVSVLKFSYSDSSDWIPVVVRRKDPQTDITLDKISTDPKPALPDQKEAEEVAMPPSPPPPPIAAAAAAAAAEEGGAIAESGWGIEEVMGWVRRNWRASYYWPLVGMLVLFCVVVFGRVFAVCCLLIWWYLGPTMHSENGGWVRSKKGYGRRLSGKKKGGLQR